MKNNFHIYFVILAIGLFLLPNYNFAFGTQVEKDCCSKEIATKKAISNCCKNSKTETSENNFGGKCGHANCTSAATNYSVVLNNEVQFKSIIFDFSSKKPKFHNPKTFISSGFTSVWLPPNII